MHFYSAQSLHCHHAGDLTLTLTSLLWHAKSLPVKYSTGPASGQLLSPVDFSKLLCNKVGLPLEENSSTNC